MRINLIDGGSADWLCAAEGRALLFPAVELGVPVTVQPLLHQIPDVIRMAGMYPDLEVVVDYLGPTACHGGAGAGMLGRLQAAANVTLKLLAVPGDSTEPYPHRDLIGLYQRAIELLGGGRVLLGSDFPYVGEQMPYRDAIAWLTQDVCAGDNDVLAATEGAAVRLWPQLREVSA